MNLEEAVELVIFSFKYVENGYVMVQKAPTKTIKVFTQAVKELLLVKNEIKIIGIRYGVKMYEPLLANEECANAIDRGNFYSVPVIK
jgi:UDP-glucose 4-epimerase